MIFLIILILIIVVVLFCYYQNNKVDVTEYNLKNSKIHDRIRLAQLSDLHSKPFFKTINILKNISPDLIMITGDFINDKCKNKGKMFDYAKALLDISPVIYITGNHERRLENFEELMQELKDIGFIVLMNEVCEFTVNNSLITVLGLDENQADFDDYKSRKNGTFIYKDMKPYFDELSLHSGFKIVLSHFPENFEYVKELDYSQYDFDIQFSGHAHGGQFIMPFIGPLFSPGQGVFPKYARGSFGERPKLIISRGLGNSEFPLRLFNHPEINVVTINRE